MADEDQGFFSDNAHVQFACRLRWKSLQHTRPPTISIELNGHLHTASCNIISLTVDVEGVEM